MKTTIAHYVLSLKAAQSSTHSAEDRAIYEKYLADAGVILALAETEAAPHLIASAIQQHDRLWGHTWLNDDAYKEPSAKWTAVKQYTA